MSEITSRQFPDDIQALLRAPDEELYSLLGAQALPLTRSPGQMLNEGRSGLFYAKPDTLGEGEFRHKYFQDIAEQFLKNWAAELRKAICQNDSLYEKERNATNREADLLVAAVVAAIATTIPGLAPFSGLLLALAVLIVRTGLAAFCRTKLS